MLQLFGTNAIPYVSATESDDSNIIELKHVSDDKTDEIAWKVVINRGMTKSDGLTTAITFSPGMTHHKIEHPDEVKVQKNTDGYSINTPAGQASYELNIVTKVQDKDKSSFQLQAVTTDEKKQYKATDEIEIVQEEKVEEEEGQAISESETPAKKTTSKKAAGSEADKAKKVEEKAPEEVSEQKENDQTKMKAEPQLEEEEVGVPSLSTFSKSLNPNAIPSEASGDKWPAPGSLKLDKTATETDSFAEWEVALEVEGKNLKTSSDIVLVFDRSNSMYGSRATKAKAAAKEFVESLLVDQDSTVRIALVPFGSDTGTANDPHTQFQGYGGKRTLLNAIDAIQIYSSHQSGGTNIHAGLHAAETMLSNSTADQKTIVLMSDGEPTYSLKATDYEKPYAWPGNKYDFLLKDFDYSTRVGTGTAGNKPNYGWNPYLCGFFQTCYDPHVNNHVLPTISEAKKIMDAGIGIYSVGLEVGNVPDAIYTIQNSQNKGYYQGGADDMSPIFDEIAASIGYAATNAKVTDPLGDMFDLVKDGSYSGENFSSTHGSVSWDSANETFTWDIGNIKEDEVYTLQYKVTLDCSKEPKGNTKYPTNKTTTMTYKNYEGSNTLKDFPIPEVIADTGKITKLGYRVNGDGDPVDSDGNVVSSPADAEQFYEEEYGEYLGFNKTYAVPAGDTPDGYQLHVGDDPTEVPLTNVCQIVPFGYVKTSELPAGKVTATYVDEDGNKVADSDKFEGHIGEAYETVQKVIDGYEFVKMHEDSADPTGEFTTDEQGVIYVYKQLTGTIQLIKTDEDDRSRKLEGAVFDVLDKDNEKVATLTTDKNGKATSQALPIGEYTITEIQAPYGYELSVNQALTVTVKAKQKANITVTNKQLKGQVTIIKVDAESHVKRLKAATFELQDEDGKIVATGTTDENGEYVFHDVAVGKYQLVETKAPADYRLLKKPIDVEVTPDKLMVEKTIENTEKGWSIPKTGGIGALGFYGLGLLLMAMTGFMMYRRKVPK